MNQGTELCMNLQILIFFRTAIDYFLGHWADRQSSAFSELSFASIGSSHSVASPPLISSSTGLSSSAPMLRLRLLLWL